ncbi:MAG: cobalamin biosynthesis protein CobD [Ottowia sp.]|nr:cobalamin biosynthesis protein CobD [Ottowia sp.]
MDAWSMWMNVWPLAAAPLLALLADRLLGEPAQRWHPVVWMGRWLAWAGARLAPPAHGRQVLSPARVFWVAAASWCAMAVFVWAVADLLQEWVLTQPPLLTALALGVALKPLLAWELLRAEVLAVEEALAQGVASGQVRLARLVSRDVRALDAVQVREGAIESLAENLNDSLVAPLFWFALLGLPGAALYRFANTADAMWGYPGVRGGRDWQWAGKWAARADDVLSWLPARLTALLLAACAGRSMNAAFWQQLGQQALRTPSPNGGWTMGAMALLLGVRLGKPGVYALNEAGRAPQPEDTQRACALGARVAWSAAAMVSGALLVAGALGALPK